MVSTRVLCTDGQTRCAPPLSLEIRPERAEDEAQIYKITADAFRGRPYAGEDEQDLVNRLRELRELALSLVALDQD
ncbi:MAG: hypothetical protein P8R42_10370 [Candidatus Binatia bacterium]|nr:hypothetical protein [Candidatus Binatia bacterium]